jgi:hypothetical protein
MDSYLMSGSVMSKVELDEFYAFCVAMLKQRTPIRALREELESAAALGEKSQWQS